MFDIDLSLRTKAEPPPRVEAQAVYQYSSDSSNDRVASPPAKRPRSPQPPQPPQPPAADDPATPEETKRMRALIAGAFEAQPAPTDLGAALAPTATATVQINAAPPLPPPPPEDPVEPPPKNAGVLREEGGIKGWQSARSERFARRANKALHADAKTQKERE